MWMKLLCIVWGYAAMFSCWLFIIFHAEFPAPCHKCVFKCRKVTPTDVSVHGFTILATSNQSCSQTNIPRVSKAHIFFVLEDGMCHIGLWHEMILKLQVCFGCCFYHKLNMCVLANVNVLFIKIKHFLTFVEQRFAWIPLKLLNY